MSKHTDGTWSIRRAPGMSAPFIVAPHPNGGIVHITDSVYSESDASLISAAPDLLAACKAIEAMLAGSEERYIVHGPRGLMAIVRDMADLKATVDAALAKAEGTPARAAADALTAEAEALGLYPPKAEGKS